MIRLIFSLVVSLWIAQAPAQHVLPSERLFQSEVPLAYRTQVKAFVNCSLWHHPHLLLLTHNPSKAVTPYEKKALAFLQHLQGITLIKDSRQWHQQLIHQLRSFSEGETDSSSTSKEMDVFLDSFLIWLFTEVDVLHTFSTSFEKEAPLPTFKDDAIKPLLQRAYDSYRFQSRFNGYSSEGHLSDNLLEGNMPLLLTFFEKSPKKVPVVRSGGMFVDKKTALEVDILFKRYLKALEKKGKKHLYINLMRYGPYSDAKDMIEVGRTQLLVNLENEFPSVRIISLDKNCDFYHQKNAFKSLHRAEEFKSQFLAQLLLDRSESHYYWSKHLDRSRWDQTLQQVIQKVHQTYFKNKEKLSTLERTSFIEICYLKFMEEAIQQLDGDAVNMACRYGIDRGAGLAGLFYFDHLLSNGKLTPPHLKKGMAIVFGPGLFFHNRPIHERRVECLEAAVEHLQVSHN